MFDGGNIQLLSEPVKYYLDMANKDQIDDACGVFYNGQYWLSYTEQGSVVNNRILVYDIKRGVWTYYSGLYINCMCVWDGFGDEGELYGGMSNSTSYIYRMDYGSDDVGTAITATYETPEMDMGFLQDKGLRYLDVDYFDAPATVTITYTLDDADSSTTDTVTITVGTATAKRKVTRLASDLADFKFISIRISITSADPTFKIYGLTLHWGIKRMELEVG